MDPKSSNWRAAAIEEDGLRGNAFADERGEFGDGGRPKRTETLLSSLSGDFNAGEVQIQVGDLYLSGLRSSGSCVVEKQKQGMVAPALRGSPIWGREQGVDLWPFEIRNDGFAGFFERYRTDLPGPFDVHRTMFADEACERANGGKPLVARGDGAVT